MIGHLGGESPRRKAVTYTANKYREKRRYTSMLLVGFDPRSKCSIG
jgi:hypothetical protein